MYVTVDIEYKLILPYHVALYKNHRRIDNACRHYKYIACSWYVNLFLTFLTTSYIMALEVDIVANYIIEM